jgi:hypothetical protein
LAACPLLADEQVVGLAQDEDVRAALALGHVRDRCFGGVDPRMDVLPALLGERPLEHAPVRCGEEFAQCGAQVAGAAARGQCDRPVAGLALRPVQLAAQPCGAVGGQVAELRLVA